LVLARRGNKSIEDRGRETQRRQWEFFRIVPTAAVFSESRTNRTSPVRIHFAGIAHILEPRLMRRETLPSTLGCDFTLLLFTQLQAQWGTLQTARGRLVASDSTLDLERLLLPISADKPCGESLRLSAEWSKLSRDQQDAFRKFKDDDSAATGAYRDVLSRA